MSLLPTTPAPRPGSTRWFFPAVLALGVAAVIGLTVYAFKSGPTEPAPARLNTFAINPAEQKADPSEESQAEPRTKPAPELNGGTAWLNTAGPLRLRDLRGKIVVLDFWTLCCINCIHTLPELAKIEKKYANEVVVIGIHTPKFDNERNTDSIRKAIMRYEVKHPVLNDANRVIWGTYGVNSWPSLVLIDPEGNLVAAGSGEGLCPALDEAIAKLIKIHTAKKTLNVKPLKFERMKESVESPLFFPGKVVADGPGNRLFIADSTNHRIVITDLDGKKIAVAGTGQPGNKDGSFDEAQFNDPQGMAFRGNMLYVADRKNHLIRELDLQAKTVKTIAGTGQQGQDRDTGGLALRVGLNSPWDVLLHDDKLFIALAGHHQIWTLDLKKDLLTPYAGSGREYLTNGTFDKAAFAQPSGLATDGKNLFVADSEVSAVRVLPMNGEGKVGTLVGEHLFTFGDLTFNPAARAAVGFGETYIYRLQHAIGVTYVDGKIYVADTYNSKIKELDPVTRRLTTFAGAEPNGWLSSSLFQEPGGLSYANGKLYVADTNAHRIRVVDMKTRAVSTLKLQGVEAPKLAP